MLEKFRPISPFLISFLVLWVFPSIQGCMTFNNNNNNTPTVGTSTTTSTGGTTLSGTALFPATTIVAAQKAPGNANPTNPSLRGVVNFTVLRVYINNIFFGFLSSAGTFSFSNVPLSTEYKVEIKNASEILLLKSIQASTVQTLTSTTTAQALILEQARLSNPSLSSSVVTSTLSAVLTLVSQIEALLADATSLSSTNTLGTKSLFSTTAVLSTISSGATSVLTGTTTSTSTTTTTTTTTTTSSTTTTASAIFSSSLANSTQVDRMGLPAINTALLGTSDKGPYNSADPKNDVTTYRLLLASGVQALNSIATYSLALVDGVPMVPDLLRNDTATGSAFPNGRILTDDVMDTLLNLLTNGATTSDGVGANDRTHSTSFPYLAGPN